MISLLITLAILGLIYYLINWGVGAIPIPAPFSVIIRALLILWIVIYLVGLLTGGSIGGIHIPKF